MGKMLAFSVGFDTYSCPMDGFVAAFRSDKIRKAGWLDALTLDSGNVENKMVDFSHAELPLCVVIKHIKVPAVGEYALVHVLTAVKGWKMVAWQAGLKRGSPHVLPYALSCYSDWLTASLYTEPKP